MGQKRLRRGAALAIVVITALICSIIAYGILIRVKAQAIRSRAFENRMKARYVAEAGYIIAYHKLLQNPNYPGCPTPGETRPTTELVDTNGDGTGDRTVAIEVTNCGIGRDHTINAQAVY